MNKHDNKNLAEELTHFLIKLSDSNNKETLRKHAFRLIDSVSASDFQLAERNLIRNGIPPRKIQQLSASFILMGLSEKKKSDLRSHLPDYHILRKVMAEHEMFRCFLADLEEVAASINDASHLSPTCVEIMRLGHITEHLNSLEEHIERENDVLFPSLREHGWESLFCHMEGEHTYIQAAIDELVKLVVVFEKIPFENFKTKLNTTVRYLCPLLREHLYHEDQILFPLAVTTVRDPDLWEHLRKVCNELGYCGIHL